MNIAIIPARGGSKRIPRKNIKLFHGKPIIVYAIESALKSKLFDKVIVSTDDQEIAEIALKNGAEVPFFRSKENSDDFASTSDVLLEVIHFYKNQNLTIGTACCLYATSPLIDSLDLKAAFTNFQNQNFVTLFSAVKFDFPIQRAFSLDQKNSIKIREEKFIHTRSQDLEDFYHDAGAFYFFNVDSFLKSKTLWSEQIGAFVLPNQKVQDIDNIEDWIIAEIKYERLHQ